MPAATRATGRMTIPTDAAAYALIYSCPPQPPRVVVMLRLPMPGGPLLFSSPP
jgi:hypothetical protein